MGAAVGTKGGFNDINMTPLIDIVLVVLIIMMVNIPIQMEEMGLSLPPKLDKPPPPPDEPVEQLVIAIYEDGKIALNRGLTDEDTMFGEIGRRLRPMAKKNVFVDAHPLIPFGQVVDMIDLARRAGAERVGLAKLKAEGPSAATSILSGQLPQGVIFGSPSVVGALTEKKADEALTPAKAAIEACYTTALGGAPGLKGQIVAQVDVGPQGEIMATELSVNSSDNAALGACIQDKTKALRFEALGDDKTARVRYPMLLSPGQ
jgi:biopolymer transport protein ExbD